MKTIMVIMVVMVMIVLIVMVVMMIVVMMAIILPPQPIVLLFSSATCERFQKVQNVCHGWLEPQLLQLSLGSSGVLRWNRWIPVALSGYSANVRL